MKRNKLKGCPTREDFVRFCLGESDDGARRAILDHALMCPVCRPRLRVLTQLRTQVETRSGGIPEAALTREETGVLRKMAGGQLKSLSHSPRPLRLRLLPVAALASVGVFALLSGYLLLKNVRMSNVALRGAVSQELRLLEPGVKIAAAPAAFSWNDVKGRDDFLFVLIDDSLNTIYEAGTRDTHLRLPDEERQRLKKGVTYLWTVRALDGSGRELGWASREFQIE